MFNRNANIDRGVSVGQHKIWLDPVKMLKRNRIHFAVSHKAGPWMH